MFLCAVFRLEDEQMLQECYNIVQQRVQQQLHRGAGMGGFCCEALVITLCHFEALAMSGSGGRVFPCVAVALCFIWYQCRHRLSALCTAAYNGLDPVV